MRAMWVMLFVCSLAAASAFAQTYGPGACRSVPNSRKCIDATPCKTDSSGNTVCLSGVSPLPSGALTVSQTCWQYSYTFACQKQALTDNCGEYETNPACGVVGSTCTDTIAETGQCDIWTYTYRCQTQAEQTAQRMSCSTGLFNTASFATPNKPNNNFAQAAITQEIMRQAQTYSQNGLNIFGGVSETCTKGYFGLKNCCKSAPGAKSNAAVMNIALQAAGSVVKYVGANAVDVGSQYVFDAMYNNGIWSDALMSNFANANTEALGTNLASGGFSLSAYGFSFGSGAMPAGLFGGNIAIPIDGLGGSYVAFNPYVFAAQVAIAVIMDLMQCTQQEQLLALHKGASLSVFIREDCTNEVPLLGCLEWTDTYCSFNSVLAKIVNMQGKPQLGLSVDDCSGFTTDQLSKLNFSKIDFSEFTGQLMQQAISHYPQNMSGNYQPVMNSASKGSSQGGASIVTPSY